MTGERAPGDDRTVAQLVQDATEQMRTLVRDEMRLAGLEVQRKGRRLGVAAGSFGGAGAVVFYALGALIVGLGLLLALVVPGWAAALIMCAALAIVAGILALAGRKSAKRAVPPIPTEALQGAKRDVQTITEEIHR